MGTMPVTDATFHCEVLRSHIPVLVDFGAAWCGPCQALKPLLEQLAAVWAGRLKVVTVDIDSSPVVTANYGVRSVPMLVLFKGGRPVGQFVGNPGSLGTLNALVRAHV